MRILVTADTHLIGDWKAKTLPRLRALWRTNSPDALVIAGDIAEPDTADEALKLIRRVTGPGIPIAIALGNHDLWAGKRARRKAVNPEDIQARFWTPAAAKHQVTLLDDQNAVFDELTIVGGYGHYDYSLAHPGLEIGGRVIGVEDYARGTVPKPPLRWRDKKWMPCERGDLAEAQRQAVGLECRLAAALARKKPILVTMHTAPFDELIGYPIDPSYPETFFRAYGGSTLVAAVIEKYADQIALLACGHTHCQVDPLRITLGSGGSILSTNIGSNYGTPEGILFDSKRMTAVRV